ncbi:MAG: nucleoside triphosphate pyrophosphohydrolase [Oscillospiraceae bacterium]|nr:nucleoside triphosphate pyrophosphohydrolase [Candidatus Ruminococcus equi]
MDFEFKSEYNLDDLISIMRILRSPNGCPWDKVQTHKSIRDNFIEETYEAVEAIDTEDSVLLKEELGDVLMQIIFHTLMEEEQGRFNFDSVCDGVCKKLIIRHPHIFSDTTAETPEEVLKNWDNIKMEEKSQATFSDSVDSVAKSLPSLIRAQKVQKRASKAGMDFPSLDDAFDKISEETEELKQAVSSNDKDKLSDELGDLLFSVVNVARFLKVDSEHALYDATDKFATRFRKVETLCTERGIDMKTADISLIDSLWEEVK